MNIPRSWWYTALVALFAAVLLPWIGQQTRRVAGDRCALDGAEVNKALGVQIMTQEHGDSRFCSLYCAERWLRASRVQPAAITVTDEPTGEKLDAASAFYVRSSVVAHPPTRERRHVFRNRRDAEHHAAGHFGRILEEEERPFAAWLNRLPQLPGK